jgi:LPXTG-motif cell wall-anchored protein
MRKTILGISLAAIFAFSGLTPAIAQEQPKPKKDTVNIDTDAKPTFYYDIEDEKAATGDKSSAAIIAIIAGAVVLAGAVTMFLLKKKKSKE